jgi:hypothetical protein
MDTGYAALVTKWSNTECHLIAHSGATRCLRYVHTHGFKRKSITETELDTVSSPGLTKRCDTKPAGPYSFLVAAPTGETNFVAATPCGSFC